jgi:hypothetical protein
MRLLCAPRFRSPLRRGRVSKGHGLILGVSDHALLRFLERAGGLDIGELRARLTNSLIRAHAAARSLGDSDYLIRSDGLLYVVRGETVTTIVDDGDCRQQARTLAHRQRRGEEARRLDE